MDRFPPLVTVNVTPDATVIGPVAAAFSSASIVVFEDRVCAFTLKMSVSILLPPVKYLVAVMFPENVPPVLAGTMSAVVNDLKATMFNSSPAAAPVARTMLVPLVAV